MNIGVKLQELGEHPTFIKLQSTFTNYSPYCFQPLKETGISEFIAWALNPREAHKSMVFCNEFASTLWKP